MYIYIYNNRDLATQLTTIQRALQDEIKARKEAVEAKKNPEDEVVDPWSSKNDAWTLMAANAQQGT